MAEKYVRYGEGVPPKCTKAYKGEGVQNRLTLSICAQES